MTSTALPSTDKKAKGPLVSRTGVVLSRPTAFQFTLDPTATQRVLFAKCAGARRSTYNHHIGRVKENIAARETQREALGAGIGPLTPNLSWAGFSLINEFNAYKNGELHYSPENEDGTRGLAWRTEIPESVFECASVDAAASLKNWHESKSGSRRGSPAGFPKFSAKNRSTPSFRLRNRATDNRCQSVRFTDKSHLRLPKIGVVRVSGPTRQVRRMLTTGRLHIYSATVTYRGGKWLVSLTGVAAELHPERRSPTGRHELPVGVDRGITSLAVAADSNGQLLADFEGVKQLRSAESSLIKAQKALARTTPGSKGRAKAKAILNKRHRKVALTRQHLVHQVSSWLVTNCQSVVLEDLNVAGMVQNRHLAKSISDAGMGELRRQIEYKGRWFGVEIVIADRFFASTKTCSSCREVKDAMDLSERLYHCDSCGLTIGRDHNAAINLARWAPKESTPKELASAVT